jgi:hypothetical protein
LFKKCFTQKATLAYNVLTSIRHKNDKIQKSSSQAQKSQFSRPSKRPKKQKNNKQKGKRTMTRQKKKQDDRLLKQLSHLDRKHQERIRQMILSDPVFKTI